RTRHSTGALVGRHPFGGWKASSVGPGAKVGGPNYVLELAHWPSSRDPAEPSEDLPADIADLLDRCLGSLEREQARVLCASAASYVHAWRSHFSREHDPTRILGERNVFRYRPCREMLVRGESATPTGRLALGQTVLAARICHVPVTLSLARGDAWPSLADQPGLAIFVEDEGALIQRLHATPKPERLRAIDPISLETQAAAHEAAGCPPCPPPPPPPPPPL